MITEDYVSFETAKLLKEKGFDEKCFQYYVIYAKWDGVPFQDYAIEFRRLYSEDEPLINSKGLKRFSEERNKHSVFSAPTIQMAMKWLREKHNLHVEVRITNHGMTIDIIKYYWVMTNTETGRWCDESTIYTAKAFDTPEEAEEDAIRHALEKM